MLRMHTKDVLYSVTQKSFSTDIREQSNHKGRRADNYCRELRSFRKRTKDVYLQFHNDLQRPSSRNHGLKGKSVYKTTKVDNIAMCTAGANLRLHGDGDAVCSFALTLADRQQEIAASTVHTSVFETMKGKQNVICTSVGRLGGVKTTCQECLLLFRDNFG